MEIMYYVVKGRLQVEIEPTDNVDSIIYYIPKIKIEKRMDTLRLACTIDQGEE